MMFAVKRLLAGCVAALPFLAMGQSAHAHHVSPQVLIDCEIYAREYAAVAARVDFSLWQCAYDHGYKLCVAGWGPTLWGAANIARATTPIGRVEFEACPAVVFKP